MASSLAGRAFLSWAAFLAVSSWCGIALAEAERFSAGAALAAGGLAALAVALGLCGVGRKQGGSTGEAGEPRGSSIAALQGRASPAAAPLAARDTALVGVAALLLTLSLLPTIDTTLLSQDASIHLASGRWLARTGSLAIPDPTLEGLSDPARRALFETAAVGIGRVSQSRLPGGLVAVDWRATTTYPSFAHLLAVWVALAASVGGDQAIALLGPLFAFTAWWAIGLLALARGSALSAVATLALLASFMPEHWFGRFLMPEILAQALLWAGVAAAATAASATEGAIAGACLGVAAFARLEQLTSFVPALLAARALLPTARRVLPRGALAPLALALAHAALHLVIIPTDYGKRIAVLSGRPLLWTWLVLGATPRSAVLRLCLAALAVTAVGVVLRRRRKGLFTRLAAAAGAAASFAWILIGQLPERLPALTWLRWYVPLPALAAAVLGLLPPVMPSGLGLALAIEALDQVVSPRVTAEQIWAARRLVTVVLPLLALAAGYAVARRDRPRSRLRAWLGGALIAAALVQGGLLLRPVFGRSLQAHGAGFAREVAAAMPRGSTVVLAEPLNWLHLAPSLWLEAGLNPIIARPREDFLPALDEYLSHLASREVFVLAGVVTTGDGAIDPNAFRPALPEGYELELVRTFSWSADLLERTEDRRPAALVKHRAEIALLRARRSAALIHE